MNAYYFILFLFLIAVNRGIAVLNGHVSLDDRNVLISVSLASLFCEYLNGIGQTFAVGF